MAHKGKDISPAKARKILRDGQIGGKPLTKKQRGLFGSIVSADEKRRKRVRKKKK